MLAEETLNLIQKIIHTRNDTFLYVLLMEEAKEIAKKNPNTKKWHKKVYLPNWGDNHV